MKKSDAYRRKTTFVSVLALDGVCLAGVWSLWVCRMFHMEATVVLIAARRPSLGISSVRGFPQFAPEPQPLGCDIETVPKMGNNHNYLA